MKATIQNNWSLLMFSGILALAYGILAIFASDILLLSIISYLGILVLIAGFAMLYGVYSNHKNHLPYGFDLVQSIIVLGLGFVLYFYSHQSLEILVIIIGSWAIIMGVAQLLFSFNMPNGLSGKTTFIINGIVTLLFGVLLLFNPFEMAAFVVVTTGIVAILMGVVMIVLSLKLKSFQEEIEIED